MFFYFDYDQIVDHGSASNSTNTIPTPATMGGDFTGQWKIYDPTTQTIATRFAGNPYPVRQSFASDGILAVTPFLRACSTRLHRNTSSFTRRLVGALARMVHPSIQANCIIAGGKFIPGSTGSEGEPTNNFYSTAPGFLPDETVFRTPGLRHHANNRLSMSDSQDDSPQVYPSSVAPGPIGWETGDVTDNQAQITDVWNISPTMINEARFGYTYEDSDFGDLSLNGGIAAAMGWQFAKADDFPAIQSDRSVPLRVD